MPPVLPDLQEAEQGCWGGRGCLSGKAQNRVGEKLFREVFHQAQHFNSK